MDRPRRPRPTPARAPLAAGLVAALTLAAATTWTAGAPADAAAAAAAAAGPATSVTLVLAAPDPDGLEALAAQPITDRDERLQQLAALLPGAEQRAEVVDRLQADGYEVTAETTWTVTATAGERQVDRQFGSDQDTDGDDALPDLPRGLDDKVSTAYLTVSDDPTLDGAATTYLTGQDLRNAGTAAGVTPLSGQHDGGLTIATLQLATWDSGDLSRYAAYAGLPDPIAAGRYRQIQVDGGATSSTGQIEVALDQESILSTAPTATQAAYFAPNSLGGFSDALATVLGDVTGAAGTPAPDPHLAALSISWGQCESGWRSAGVTTIQPILASLAAAGVTVFAASGDHGVYDCNVGATSAQEDVDFPASSPSVVAVGGSRLSAASSTPNAGTTWGETAWTCTSAASCQGSGGGTGGGVSGSAFRSTRTNAYFVGFTKPDYQSSYVTAAPFAAVTKRMVPDITADGDPSSGFVLYSSDSSTGTQHLAAVGGTSLAAPVSAAQLVNLLGDTGTTRGVGDIHTALYRAASATSGLAVTDPARVFRDVTSGSNGAQANVTADPSTSAAVGYDTVSGLGGVLWPALAPYLSLPAPVSTLPAPAPNAGSATATTGAGAAGRVRLVATLETSAQRSTGHRAPTVTATWRTKPPAGLSAHTVVKLTRGGRTRYACTQERGKAHLVARPGRYTLTVVSTDSAGHTARTVRHLTVR